MRRKAIGTVADNAATTLSGTGLRGLPIQLVAEAGAALLASLVNTTLAVGKPPGITPYFNEHARWLSRRLAGKHPGATSAPATGARSALR